MKQLLLMRHAKSSWRDKDLSDFDRPLKRRGQRAALRMGQHLREQHLIPSLIVSSTAERAHATGELLLSEFPEPPELELRDELYHALPKTIVRVIRDTDDDHDSLMIVGHNPGLEELVFQWSADFVEFCTTAIAHYSLNINRWSELKLNLVQNYENLWKPKELDGETTETSPQPE
ncbi:histidine phosphatase family protein [Planctomycetaceae bacterium]|nr:histidine phosphatase family protein [bacterium]MDC0261963.1 histidine phosphatase family protein [Planctomycetaceae bacterium]MDC0274165.1 histidine phosphatase family protein [Planctomycetaceae bacterium]MDG2388537.1 histidine phosphatase family protein [Planctomycetaceae bacterium]